MAALLLAQDTIGDAISWADTLAQLPLTALLLLLGWVIVRAVFIKRQVVTASHHDDVVRVKDEIIANQAGQIATWQAIASKALNIGETAVAKGK